MYSQVKIIELNVNSLISIKKRAEFERYVHTHNPDIILLVETKLNHYNQINIKNYNIIRTDRLVTATDTLPTRGVGTAILIRNNLKYNTIDPPNTFKKTELTAIKLNISNNKSIIITSLYSHPRADNMHITLNQLMNFFSQQYPNFPIIIGGDFNCRNTTWGDQRNNKNGKMLQKWLTESHFAISMIHLPPDKPTYMKTNRINNTHATSYLDHFLISQTILPNLITQYKCQTLPIFSDHAGISLDILVENLEHAVPNKKYFDYTNTNWFLFKESLQSKCKNHLNIPNNRNLDNIEIDQAITSLTNTIQSVMNTVIPKKLISANHIYNLPATIIYFIKDKHKIKRKLFKLKQILPPNNPNISNLKAILKIYDTLISSHIQKDKNSKLKSVLKKLNTNDRNVFKNIKRITNQQIKPSVPTIIHNNTYLNSSEGKASIFSHTFAKVHTQNIHMGNPLQNQRIEDFYTNYLESNIPTLVQFCNNISSDNCNNNLNGTHFTNISSVTYVIRNLKNTKTTGSDQISNYIIRKLPTNCLTTLLIIINNCLNNSYFPSEWKNAIITPILKNQKIATDASSYRPISILPSLSKILERVFLNKLNIFLEEENILPDIQFGFRPEHNASHAIDMFINDTCDTLNRKLACFACAIDIEKAFDTVWHAGLIFKLQNTFHFNPHTIKFISNFLTNRSFQIHIENSYSNKSIILAGVPQGAVISPVLFSIYTADIPVLPNCNSNPKISLYADDAMIYFSSPRVERTIYQLNEYLNTLYDYYNFWKIKINIEKCEYIIIRPPYRDTYPSTLRSLRQLDHNNIIKINNISIKNSQDIKYLGINLNCKFNFNKHVQKLRTKFLSAKWSLKKILTSRNTHKNVKLLCYKQLLRPILTYSFTSWFSINSRAMEELRSLERKTLRQCLNVNRLNNINNLYQECDIERLDYFLIKLANKHFTFTNNHYNNHIKTIYDTAFMQQFEANYKPPKLLKYLIENNCLYIDNKLLLYHIRRNNNINSNNLELSITDIKNNINTSIYNTLN